MRTVLAFALVLALLGGSPGEAEARYGMPAGSWFVEVIPLPAPPEVPEPPPPFVGIINFGLAGTMVETDTNTNPNSLASIFPPDFFPPFSSSNGFGSWKWTGRNRFRCTFIKILFDEAGAQIGLVITTLDLVVTRDGRLEGEGDSDFVRGSDPEGEVFFTGSVILEGARLRVEDW